MPYDEWEDYKNGMYALSLDVDRAALALGLLRCPDEFRETAREMLRAWPVAAQHNLGNLWTGRRAWVGQASCCYAFGATSADTRSAWGCMTNAEQRAANSAADAVIAERRMGVANAQTLFGV